MSIRFFVVKYLASQKGKQLCSGEAIHCKKGPISDEAVKTEIRLSLKKPKAEISIAVKEEIDQKAISL